MASSPSARTLWLVAVADFVLTYPWAFAANALTPPDGPHAPWTYWIAQPWVYAFIAPVAAVAAWRGVCHVRAAGSRRQRWWQLPSEGFVVGIGVALLAVLIDWPPHFSVRHAISEVLTIGVLVGSLGLLLSATNALLIRVLTPARSALTIG
jgi:hypothetical protein